jgi:endonuclease-3
MKRKSAEDKMPVIISRLKKRYRKEMMTSLDYVNPWELLVSTMLSAQCTDVQVNKATPALFKRYPDPKSMARLRPQQLYPYVKTLGFYRNKAKNIVGAAKRIQDKFGGKIPRTMDELLELPGVGRKTANVVLSNAFGTHYGLAIDTHCITVTNRLFLYDTEDPVKIERRLMGIVPKRDWGNLTHLFIALGRDVCTVRRKYCSDCVLKDICPSSDVK